MNSEAVKKLVFGKTGSGKTEKVKKLVADRDRVLFYDTLGHDYKDGVVLYRLDDLKEFWRKVHRQRFRIIFRSIDHDEDFPRVCRLVAACKNMSFVVEEMDLFFSGGKCCRELNNLIFRGRHYGIELIAVTQRPYGIGRGFTSQTNEFYIFRSDEPCDLKYFRERCGEQVAGEIQKLDRYYYVECKDYGERTCTIKKDTL
jgi:hypothetical protein